jgi:hypothetical protein
METVESDLRVAVNLVLDNSNFPDGDNPEFLVDLSPGEKNASISSRPFESLRPVSLTINPVFLLVSNCFEEASTFLPHRHR